MATSPRDHASCDQDLKAENKKLKAAVRHWQSELAKCLKAYKYYKAETERLRHTHSDYQLQRPRGTGIFIAPDGSFICGTDIDEYGTCFPGGVPEVSLIDG